MDQLNRIISLFNNIRYNDIKTIVKQNKLFIDSLIELKEKEFSLYSRRLITNYIEREGDVIVGFFTEKSITFKIKYDDYEEVIELNNEFKYTFKNCYPLLLNALDYNNSNIEMIDGYLEDIYIIYGLLRDDARRYIASDNFITFDNNYIYYSKRIVKYNYLNNIIPMMRLKIYNEL